MLRFSLIPRKERFFDLFEESAHNLIRAAEILAALMIAGDDIPGKAGQIKDLEHHGDTIIHQIIARLHGTFVTPLDREDIAALAHSLDDVLDFIDAAADAMLIYKVTQPTSRAAELAAIVVQATLEVEKAVACLRHRHRLKQILEHCVEINRLENEADKVMRQALAELFTDSKPVTDVIKWREIYEHIESATDRCEDVANVLEGVVLKHA